MGKTKNNYGRKYQSQKEQNSSKSPNKGYSYKSQIYDTKNNKGYNLEDNKEQNNYKSSIRSKYQKEQKSSSSPSKGNSYKKQIYTDSNSDQNQNINSNLVSAIIIPLLKA